MVVWWFVFINVDDKDPAQVVALLLLFILLLKLLGVI